MALLDQISVWTLSLDQPEAVVEKCYNSLAEDEKARADRYKVAGARRSYVLTRWALRSKLGECLEREPRELRFSYGEFDKPQLAETEPRGLSFNVSHSGDWAVIAIGPYELMGIDIEKVRAVNNLDSLARTVFSDNELSKWFAELEELRAEQLFRKWTQKEACLKAVGVGLSTAMSKLEIREADEGLQVETLPDSLSDAMPCSLQTFSQIEGYVISLALGRCSELPEIFFREFAFTSG